MKTNSQRGAALILALMLLSFLAVIGGALLTSLTLDVWISDNYKTHTQALYLAEAGLELARANISASGAPLATLLTTAAGPNGLLSSSRDLNTLLASDDVPIVSVVDPTGVYRVWLRNDLAEGVTSPADSNGVVTLLSIAVAGNSRTTMEMDIRKGAFPDLLTGLTVDPSGLDPRLKTTRGLNGLVGAIGANATNSFGSINIGNYGSATNYPVAVVNGDCTLGPGTGFGLLLVSGNLTMSGNFAWSGLILVIGQGVLHWNAGANGQVTGGVFLARTVDGNPAVVDMNGAGGPGIQFDSSAIAKANASFPFTPIAFREY